MKQKSAGRQESGCRSLLRDTVRIQQIPRRMPSLTPWNEIKTPEEGILERTERAWRALRPYLNNNANQPELPGTKPLRIGLEFWWGLHWICRLLLVKWPFSLYKSCQSMSMGDLSIFWGLLQFLFQWLEVLSYRSFPCSVKVTPRYFILFGTITKGFISLIFSRLVSLLCRWSLLIWVNFIARHFAEAVNQF